MPGAEAVSDDAPRDEALVDRPAEDDIRLWSVTTIIDQSSNKDALINWAAKETAKAAVSGMRSLQAIIADDGPDAAIDWLKGSRFRAGQGQRTAKELGTAIHRACETYALTGVKPTVDAEIAPFLDRFDEWVQSFQPDYKAAEMTVYSPTYGYAGTLDAVLHVGGQRVVADYKTSRDDVDDRGKPKGPWPDVALQLAAYRHAEFAAAWRVRRFEQYRRRYYLLGDNERADAVEIPDVDGGLCLYITPQRCEAHFVRCDAEVFEAFLDAVDRSRWALGTLSRSVLGPAISPPVTVR